MAAIGDARRFVIAVDAGGTHTRVAAVGLDGSLISTVAGRGGSPYHNPDSVQNVAAAVQHCLDSARLDAGGAVALVAGLAAISRAGSNQGDGDNGWADDYFAIPSLKCRPLILNDAVVAHRGALLGTPGVIVVAGTGSMILAIAEDGTEIESGQFEHYAGAARHLVFEAMQLILTGEHGADDGRFVAEVLDFWNADGVAELRTVILSLPNSDDVDMRRRYGQLAPAVTRAADSSPLADRALRSLAAKTARGVQLLAPFVHSDAVPVAVAGALASTDAFSRRLHAALNEHPGNRAVLVPTALDPLRGSALIGLQQAGIRVDDDVVGKLRASIPPGPS